MDVSTYAAQPEAYLNIVFFFLISPPYIYRFNLYALTSSSSMFCFNCCHAFPSFLGRLADSQNVFVNVFVSLWSMQSSFYFFFCSFSFLKIYLYLNLFQCLQSPSNILFSPYVYIVGFQSLMNFKNTLTTKIWYTKYLTLYFHSALDSS